jgi:hypothetical protein
MLLSKEAILSVEDLPSEDVDVPEWGGTVRIKGLSGRERDRFEAGSIVTDKKGVTKPNYTNLRARLVALSIVGEDGRRLFSDTDVNLLGAKSASALERVFKAAQKLNGMTDADVEEMTEDFGEDHDETSTTD